VRVIVTVVMLHAAIGVKPAAPVMAMSDKRCGWVSVIRQLYVAALRFRLNMASSSVAKRDRAATD
jgi:hypothetical protein